MRNNGFTLIELLAVLVIIGAVMALAVPAILGSGDSARNKLSEIEERNLKEAGKMLAIDLNDSSSAIYNCSGWTSSTIDCTKVNNQWTEVMLSVKDLKNHGYFTDNSEHIDENIYLIIESNYTVNIADSSESDTRRLTNAGKRYAIDANNPTSSNYNVYLEVGHFEDVDKWVVDYIWFTVGDLKDYGYLIDSTNHFNDDIEIYVDLNYNVTISYRHVKKVTVYDD